jgi:predicted deacylase
MASKQVVWFPVRDDANGQEVSVPIGIAEGDRDGAALTVVGGVHGTEYAAQDAVARFWDELDPAALSGRVHVVLAADPTAIIGHSAYVSPSDGKNMNRVWPGDAEGTLTERIAHLITTECVLRSDAVIDVHGGEWDEDIDCFIITHRIGDEELDTRTLDLAMALGFTYVEVTDADGAVLGAGTGSGEAVRGGRPGLTLEAGGAGQRDPAYIDMHVHALRNALRHLGILEGAPILYDGAPVLLDHGVLMKTTTEGLYVPKVRVGQWVEVGDVFAEVRGFDGELLEQLTCPERGTVLDVIIARAIKAGGFAGKLGILPDAG